jgi:hypothetical protein
MKTTDMMVTIINQCNLLIYFVQYFSKLKERVAKEPTLPTLCIKSSLKPLLVIIFIKYFIIIYIIVGGLIPWKVECRLKHLGTGKYLSLNKNILGENGDDARLYLELTRDVRRPDTIFILHPVDKGDRYITYGGNNIILLIIIIVLTLKYKKPI